MTGFTQTVRRIIRKRAGGRCERCDWYRGRHIHHRRVKGIGGSKQESTSKASNGLLLCPACHTQVHHNPQSSFKNGWLVSQWADPAEVSVLYRGERVLLDDLGNVQKVEQ